MPKLLKSFARQLKRKYFNKTFMGVTEILSTPDYIKYSTFSYDMYKTEYIQRKE